MAKNFKLPANAIRPLATGRGSCIASDEITVGGRRVGYMYREEAYNELDSGWRFFAGDESEAYTANPRNFELYDVNTLANYDPEIIAHLDAPAGSVFSRNAAGVLAPDPPLK